MPKKTRTYSAYTLDTAYFLGKLIKHGRTSKKMTAQDLSDRAGISRGLLLRIEKGDPRCELGIVFEVAALVGVKLFDADDKVMSANIERIEDKLALLPKTVHKQRKVIDDDF
ncbi:MAG: transcriptional regulator with XRE-family HTH domain [Gammaproteobacteria bacterium]|jgi:transcriptional regulator with XRE-family HTH domain